jgi:uncharacterized protein
MYKKVKDLFVIKKNGTYFFDPKSLLIFSKQNIEDDDNETINSYNEYKKSFPKEKLKTKSIGIENVVLELHVINDCNLRCKYCYVDGGYHGEKNRFMSDEIIEKAFNFILKSFPRTKEIAISLYGGEPLLFWKKFDSLIKKAKEILQGKKITFNFPTNGTIVNQKILKLLKNNKMYFQISMDGIEKQQNFLRPTINDKESYRLLEKNIPYFKSIRDTLSVRSTITSYNTNLSELFLFFKEKGFKSIAFSLCSSQEEEWMLKKKDISKLLQEYTKLSDIYLKHLVEENNIVKIFPFQRFLRILHFGEKRSCFCGIGNNLFAISTDGDIYACHRFIGNNKYKIGNLYQGFEKNNSIQDAFMKCNIINEKCSDCFALNVCRGGCQHEKQSSFFDITCLLTKHIFYLSIWMYGEITSKYPKILEKIF